MTERELFEKVARGARLEPAEQLLLDQVLEIQSTDGPGVWMKSLHDPEPSLAWRSQLNGRLAEIAPPKRSRPLFGSVRPVYLWLGAGSGLAAVSFAAVLLAGRFAAPDRSQAPGDRVASPDMVADAWGDSQPDLGMVLVTSHQSDEVQASMGIQAPRRTIESGFDWSKIERRPRR